MTIKERIQNYLGYGGVLLAIIKSQGESDRKIKELEENMTQLRTIHDNWQTIHDNLQNDHNELYKIFRTYLYDNGFEISNVEIDDPHYIIPKILVKRVVKRKK